MRASRTIAVVALGFLLAGAARGDNPFLELEADYRDDFSGPVFPANWQYQWNKNGAIGNAANYVNMLWSSTMSLYCNEGGGSFPQGDGQYVNLGPTGGHPGPGSSQSAVARCAIAGYEVQSAGQHWITNSSVYRDSGSGEGIAVRIYVNDTHIYSTGSIMPPTTGTFNTPLGSLEPGDMIYVIMDPQTTHDYDGASWDYSIVRQAATVNNASGATNVTLTSAFLNGELPATNGGLTKVWVFWGLTNGGTNPAAWSKTNHFGIRDIGVLSTNVTLPESNRIYFYRFAASNAYYGLRWAATSSVFMADNLTVDATDDMASKAGGNPGVFTFSRPGSATNANLTIRYTMSGNAVNGTDYSTLSGNVIILEGATNATLTLTPLDNATEGTQTATLSLMSGPYLIGTPSSDSVSIQDRWTIAPGETNTWSGSGNWTNVAGWSLARVPAAGDFAVISSPMMVTSTPPTLSALTIAGGGILTCSNWNTTVRATTITIADAGIITLPGPFTSAMMSNRIHLVCSNLTVEPSGWINADERGYGLNSGPGKGFGNDLVGGSGHGGQGGYARGMAAIPNVAGGGTYGSTTAPETPGSSSPWCYAGDRSGKGGGVIRIDATGTVIVQGIISAKAGHATAGHGAGGAGGSIYITCRHFQGAATGILSARGGNYPYGSDWTGGGGGGGRIAVHYETCNLPSATFDVLAGSSHYTEGGNTLGADMGTLYLSTTNCLSPSLAGINGQLIVPGLTAWSVPSLMITNSAMSFPGNFQLTIAGNASITGSFSQLKLGPASELRSGGALTVLSGKLLVNTGSWVSCGSATVNGGELVVKGNFACATDLKLTNSGIFHIYSAASNAWPQDYGSRVAITGNLDIAAASWVYPFSDPVNGGSPLFCMQNLRIATNAGFNAVGRGYGIGQGPGSRPPGDRGTGGSHAGKGGMGDQRDVPGPTYGSSNAPVTAGSGANQSYGGLNKGFGGGVIRLEVANQLVLNGTLDASGATHLGGSQHGGGGAGGSIFIITRFFFSGSSSVLYTRGGTAGVVDNTVYGGGGGGGGRIALWTGTDPQQVYQYARLEQGSPDPYHGFQGIISVTNGLGYYNGPPDGAAPGTIRLSTLMRKGTIFIVH